MEQVSMMLPTRSGDRIPSPLILRDLDTRSLAAGYSERLGKELARRPARLPDVTAAMESGERPRYEKVCIGDIRIPPGLRLPPVVSADLPYHYAMLLAAQDARTAAGLDAIPAWRDAEGVVWIGQDAMLLQAIAHYVADGDINLSIFPGDSAAMDMTEATG